MLTHIIKIWGKGGCLLRWISTPLYLLLLPALVHAAPIEIPDSARPGAVRPEEVGKPLTPKAPEAEVMEIPAVIDRPFEIDEGPTIVVQQFRLLDAKDLPKYDVSLLELQDVLEKFKQTRPEGFTIGQMQEAADEVTRYYREKGLILAQAVVPVQVVQSGIVDIQVFEGRLGRVVAEGNLMYKEKLLRKPFKNLIGKPVTKDEIESVLLQLTDFPGLTVFGVFQPGQQVGTADIVLKVQEEKRFAASMRGDNHGLQETGRGRFRTTIDWNNVTGGADRLSFTVQQTYRPKNNTFFSANYERYLGHGFKVGMDWNRNKFDVGGDLAAQNIQGETENRAAYLDKTWFRSRQFNLSSRLTMTRKESISTTRGRQSNNDKLAVLSLETSMDQVDTRFKGINFLTLELSRGFNDILGAMGSNASAQLRNAGDRPSRQAGPPERRFASGQFSKFFMTAQRLQTITEDITFLGRAELQLTDDVLVPLEQYSVGGPDHVRAYPQAQFLFDNALFFSAELNHRMPFITDKVLIGNRTWGEIVQLSIFYDHAVGNLVSPLTSEPTDNVNFRGAGVQVRFTLPGLIDSRLMMAWPIESFERADNNRRPQIWGDITYSF